MITLDNVSYTYADSGTKALSKARAEIGPGIHLLTGENGSGKTTLLHVISGLLFPSSGRCLIDGTESRLRRIHTMESLFYLGDDGSLPMPTVEMSRKLHASFYPDFSEEILRECLAAFGVTGTERLDKLSLGIRKKSAIAYALSLQTPYLLLDEPTNGLDIEGKSTFSKLLARYAVEGGTVIISTHNIPDIKNLLDGVIILRKSELALAMPLWQISERVAFLKNPMAGCEPLFMGEGYGGGSICTNSEGIESDVDLTLLYMGLHSPSGGRIMEHLKSSK